MITQNKIDHSFRRKMQPEPIIHLTLLCHKDILHFYVTKTSCPSRCSWQPICFDMHVNVYQPPCPFCAVATSIFFLKLLQIIQLVGTAPEAFQVLKGSLYGMKKMSTFRIIWPNYMGNRFHLRNIMVLTYSHHFREICAAVS